MTHSLLRFVGTLLLVILTTAAAISQPTVSSTSPSSNARNVSASADITITFSETMDATSITTSTIKVYGSMSGIHGGSVNTVGSVVTYNPTSDFYPGEVVTVVATTGVENSGDVAMTDPYIWQYTVAAGGATTTFQTKVDYTTADGPNQVIAADIDNDGDQDIISVSPGADKISVLKNNGDATLAAKVDYTTGGYPNSVASGDFNGDGYADLVTANYSDNSISVFINNGSGSFAAKVDYSTASGAYGVAVADVDGDGNLDVVTASQGSGEVSVFLNNGGGTFASATSYSCGNDPRSITLADVDNDGDVDAIVGRHNAFKISVVFNNGNGEFNSYTDYASEGYVWSVAAADLNADGKIDLVSSNINNGNKISVFINNGDGTYASKVDYSTGSFPKHLSTGDVDGDGDIDVIVPASSDASVGVLKNNGNGTFAAKVDFTTGSQPSSAIVADLNGNGVLDIVVSNNFGNSVSIIKNVPIVTVSSTSPTANALTVSPSANITVTFGAVMNSGTMTGSTVKVNGSMTGPHSGSFSYNVGTKTMTFDPADNFARGEIVTVTLTDGIQGAGGTALSNPQSFSFTVASDGTGVGFFETQTVSNFFQKSESRFIPADVDNDGDIDLIGFYYNTGFTVSKNNGSGFDSPVNNNLVTDLGQDQSLRYGDIDGDGFGDLIAFRSNSSTYIVILKNNGSGTFSLYDSINTSSSLVYYGTEVKDFNNDGKLDIAYYANNSSQVKIAYNSPGWTNTGTYSITPGNYRVTSGDVDNDGDMDLIFADYQVIRVLKNNGDETFASAVTYNLPSNDYIETIDAQDFNNDGYIDILTAGSYNGDFAIGVNLNNGDGTFASVTAYPIGIQPAVVKIGDLDGDGDLDVAIVYQNEPKMNVAYNNGNGGFSQQALFSVHMPGIAIMDYDGDGDLDIIGKDYSSNVHLNILENTIPTAPTTDASSINFTKNFGNSVKINWTNGNGTNRIVVVRQGSAVNANPSDNTTYTPNTVFGSGNEIGSGNYVVYNGYGNSVNISGLTLSTNYYVTVFEYNGLSGGELYATTTPGTNSVLTNSVAGYPFDTTAGYAFRYNNNGYSSSNSSFEIPNAFTYELWTKPASVGSQKVILDHGDEYLWIAIDATGKFFGRVYDDNTSNYIQITGTTTAVAGQWYHLALTGANGSPLKLYVNGVLEATSGGNIGALVPGSHRLYPGTDNNENYYYSGDIDELRIWSTMRTVDQIRENMHKTLSGTPANLLNYWQFNEGTGNSVAEIVNDNNMSKGSASWVASGAPVGGATINNASVAASNNGPHTVGNVTLSMSDAFDNPVDVYVSELTADPSNYPSGYGSSLGGKYFVINLFGDPGTFSTSLTLNFGTGVITAGQESDPNLIQLFKRESNSSGSWTLVAGATSASASTGEVTWTGITSFSQFLALTSENELPPSLTITKADGADWTLPENQDRITDNVWLTREDYGVLFNIKTEESYNSNTSPAGTEWAYGTTANGIESLEFGTFRALRDSMGGNLTNLPGKDVVLHIIDEDIYLDVHFNSWSAGGDGGFSYTRSLKPLELIQSGYSNLVATSVTVSGQIYSKTTTATAYLLYGTTSGVYTDSVLITPSTIPADTVYSISKTLTGLTEGTTYYYRFAASNGSLYARSSERSVRPHTIQYWNKDNGTITFTKTNNADWNLPANQDRINGDVWITRKNDGWIFNIHDETQKSNTSPAGTEWAFGTINDGVESLSFYPWKQAVDNQFGTENMPSVVGDDMVVHLIDEDIYIDIKFTSWTSGSNGGGFSYQRATAPLSSVITHSSDVGSTTATVHGKVYSTGLSATAKVLYGISSGTYPDSVSVTPSSIDENTLTDVSVNLSSLLPGTLYYVRIAAQNDNVYVRSSEKTLMTMSDLPGYALLFDGSNDYISVNNEAAFDITSEITLEAWIKPSSIGGTKGIVTKNTGDGAHPYQVRLEDDEVTFGFYSGDIDWNPVTTTDANIATGQWVHIACTYDMTLAKIYVNGVLKASENFTFPIPTNNQPVEIGRTDASNYFHGIIDEVRIWDVARTQQQILDNMNLPFTSAQSGLIGYWQLNAGSGTAAHGHGTGGGEGTLNNFNFNENSGWIESAAPLPVELTSFTASSTRLNALLKWGTATELNNHGFEVERKFIRDLNPNEKKSSSKGDWSKIGFVEGNGTTNTPNEYSYSDKVQKPGTYSYRLKLIDRDGQFKYSPSVEVEIGSVPMVFALEQNYPNPFNPATTIGFTLKQTGHASLKIYDAIGREVAVLVNEVLEAGVYHHRVFDAGRLASGVYFARLTSGGLHLHKKLLLVK